MRKIIFTAVLFLFSCGPSEKTEIDAMTDAQFFVEKQLKSPSTAEFSNMESTLQYENIFKVTGSVDSQNSFGAMIRTNFECVVEYESATSGTHSIKNFKMY